MEDKKAKWNWTSALVGATAAAATAGIVLARPKRPTFRLISLTALKIKLRNKKDDDYRVYNQQFPILSADLILTVHVTNPNVVPVNYGPTSMSIFYDGSLLGSAEVPAGYQKPNSCELLRLSARLNGVELAQHAKRFFADVARREMVLDAVVDISGTAKALLWDPRFKVRVDSRIVLDPVLLDVIAQENKSDMKLFLK